MTMVNPKPSIPGVPRGGGNPSKPAIPNVAPVMGQFRVLSSHDAADFSLVAMTTEGPVYRFAAFFGVDSAKLHAGFVHQCVQAIVMHKLQGFHFDLFAQTSRSGTTAHNLGLAGRRMMAVQTMLTEAGVPASMAYGAHHMTLGEEFPAFRGVKDGTESGSDRAVHWIAAANRDTLRKYYSTNDFPARAQYIAIHRNSALS